jgi:crotonobetainyl-CoA:carnitine CoA-transferase CaiB-like acyl-CoA transferase
VTAGALDGIRVLDLGELVSAPYCAKLFADFGADVLKLEPPGTGEAARRWGPFPGDAPHLEKSGLFQFLNTNKRGVTLDWTRPRGRELLLELARRSDAVVEGHAPGRLAALGVGWEALSAVNRRLVLISITPFGQTGPYAGWRGCDLNAFHLSGASSRYCGRPGEAPLEHGTFSADFFGAVAGAAWGLAAVYGRDRAGGGQQLDVSCAEAVAAAFTGGQNIGAYAQDGVFDRRTGVGMSLGAPATILPCKDGHVWILALETAQWQGLVRAMGNPEWAQADLFHDMFERARNADVIYPLIQEWTERHGKHEIMQRCQAEGVPATAVFTVQEAVEHPHLRERGQRLEVEHPLLGRLPALGAPFVLPACPGGPRTAAPLLGQHSDEVYSELLGLGPAERAALRAEGVI